MRVDSLTIPYTSAISIQPATWRDMGAFRQMEKLCFPMDAWSVLDIAAALTFPNTVRLKAVKDEAPVGFIVGDRRPSQNMAWIATLGVHPGHRRRGVGSALLYECEDLLDSPRIRLSVRISNESAIRLYKHWGYQVVGTWPRYYNGGENALVMEKVF
ncbi:MAG: GNAT family N-acetyltransferase [Anaerolineales bacterium]